MFYDGFAMIYRALLLSECDQFLNYFVGKLEQVVSYIYILIVHPWLYHTDFDKRRVYQCYTSGHNKCQQGTTLRCYISRPSKDSQNIPCF